MFEIAKRLMRNMLCSDEEKRLPVLRGQKGQGAQQLCVLDTGHLLRSYAQPSRMLVIRVFNLAAALSMAAVEKIAQDREQPSLEVRPRLEAVQVSPGPQDRLLDKIISVVAVVQERDREAPQVRYAGDHLVPQ